jgi:hypothetical protein
LGEKIFTAENRIGGQVGFGGDGDNNAGVFTTEHTENTEIGAGLQSRFNVVTDAYRGRKITVIDFASGPKNRGICDARTRHVGSMTAPTTAREAPRVAASTGIVDFPG